MYRICKYCGKLSSMFYRYLSLYVHKYLFNQCTCNRCRCTSRLFHNNCVEYSEEQGECFNQDILTMEDSYQANVTINILDDYCWSLKNGYKIHKI